MEKETMKFTVKELDMINEALTWYTEHLTGDEKSSDTEHTQEEVNTLQERFSDILGY